MNNKKNLKNNKKQNEKKKIRILLTIKKIGINGEGIGYYKKKITFVKGALPDEVIFCEIDKETPKYIEATMLKIKEKSPYRKDDLEKEYIECGAYPLYHVAYEKQLEYKRNIVIDAFNKYFRLKNMENKVLQTLPSPKELNYRNKNQFPLAIRNGKVIAGLYKEGTNDIVEINKDIVLHENGNKITELAKRCIGKYKIAISTNKRHKGIKYIATRTSFATGDVQLVLVANTDKIENIDKLVADVKREKIVKSIILNITNENDHLVMGNKNIILYGKKYIVEKIGDVKYELSANSFFQLNPLQTKNLYDKVVEIAELNKNDIVLDAFCGVGTIGQYLSKRCKEVYGVDIVKQAIEDAKSNIELNKLNNCFYKEGDAAKVVSEWKKQGINFNTVVVDPPRSGLGELAKQLLTIDANKIVYVSCNPSTLAKDSQLLARKYKVKSLQPVDMFPQTAAVECIALLERKNK